MILQKILLFLGVLTSSIFSKPITGSASQMIKASTPSPVNGTSPPTPSSTSPSTNGPTGPTTPSASPLKDSIVTQCNRPGVFALTFDDGPSSYTNELLDILKKNNVSATFFINGNNVVGDITKEPYPTIIKRMVAEGHHIASHTYSHKDLITLTPDGVKDEMVKNDNAIKTILGVRPKYMRIPFGSYNDATLTTLSSLDYKIIWLNVDSLDFDHVGKPDFVKSNQASYDLGMSGSSPQTSSFISLQHDIHADTVRLWTQVAIDTVKAKGYQFVTVGDCIGEPDRANWYREPLTISETSKAPPEPPKTPESTESPRIPEVPKTQESSKTSDSFSLKSCLLKTLTLIYIQFFFYI
jgi:peptidoglycan/xylan/chitin deacetylase (PgdA/CDA1 family)